MSSYHLYPDDVEHMFEEGYSGQLAREYGEKGQGLGMYRAKKFLEWNKGMLGVIAGDEAKSVNGCLYSENVIYLKLQKAIKK